MKSLPMIEAGTRFVKFIIHGLWQILPLDFASETYAFLARFVSLRYRKTTTATRQTLRHINPAYTEQELDQILFNMWQNMGRVWAESLIPHRLAKQRLKIIGLEHLDLAKSLGRPIIAPFLHTGNCEILPPILTAHKLPPHAPVEIQRTKLFNDLINQVRRNNGLVVLSPDITGTKQIYNCLKRGDTLIIAIDEYKNGKVIGPRFGRDVQESTNLEFALRLAGKYTAVMLPMYISRLRGANFELHISRPLPPALLESSDGRERVKQDLENWSEITIRAHIDQWYMLHRLRFK